MPCDLRLRKPGALLPHPFTLACASEEAIGGLLSAALSVIGRSRRPGVTRHPALWSSDFPPSMSRRTRRRPSLRVSSESLFYRDRWGTRTTPHGVNQRVQETPTVVSRSERDTTSWPSSRNRISPRIPEVIRKLYANSKRKGEDRPREPATVRVTVASNENAGCGTAVGLYSPKGPSSLGANGHREEGRLFRRK